LERAPVTLAVKPGSAGRIGRMDCRAVGLVVMGLGGGRRRPEDAVDGAVGLAAMKPIGAEVGPTQPLAIVHARTIADAERASRELLSAVYIADIAPAAPAPVLERIGPPR